MFSTLVACTNKAQKYYEEARQHKRFGRVEMAEIYLNFGIYGSIFMPGIISYIIGYSYKKHLHNPANLFNSLLFVAILSAYLRFLLYQTFAGFKSYITILI